MLNGALVGHIVLWLIHLGYVIGFEKSIPRSNFIPKLYEIRYNEDRINLYFHIYE